MNFALPAILLFVLLLPGFIFRSRFKRAERSSLDYSPFGQVVTEAVLWAIALHAIWLTLSYLLCGRTLDTTAFLKLFSSDGASQVRSMDLMARDIHWISAYFLTLFAFTVAAPTALRHYIAKRRLDRFDHPLSGLLRFHGAPWYYLLTGADFIENEKPDLISVSAVVDVAGQAVLYTGFLDDFYVTSDGQLDRLVLESVTRRPLEKDKPSSPADDTNDATTSPERFYSIDGHYFVLRYEEMITLNINYIQLDRESVGTPPPAIALAASA